MIKSSDHLMHSARHSAPGSPDVPVVVLFQRFNLCPEGGIDDHRDRGRNHPGNEHAFSIGERTPATSLTNLPAVHMALLDQPVTASVATINADGTPQLTPNWVNHDGTHLYLNSVRGRLKDRNMRARPSVVVMLVNPQNPYHWITIYGAIDQIIEEDDPNEGHMATANIDDLAEAYLGQRPYPLRDPKGEVRVLYKVRPTRIVTFGPVGG